MFEMNSVTQTLDTIGSDIIFAPSYTLASAHTGSVIIDNEMATDSPLSHAWTDASPPFVPCRNPGNLISEKTTKLVELVLHGVMYPVFALTGITTNVISMTVFSRQGLRDRINLCLFSLALADTGFLIFMMAGRSYTLVELIDREMGSYWQQRQRNTVLGLYLGFLNVSNAMTTVIAMERCICIVAPFKAKTLLKTRYMAVVIISIYLYILSHCSLVNVMNITVRMEESSPSHNDTIVYYVSRLSSFYLRNRAVINLLYYDLIAITVPAVSLFVIIISTSITVYKLRVSLSWHRHSNEGEVTSAEQREVAVTRMLVTVCVVYVICMTPSVTFAFVRKLVTDVLPSGRYCNTFKVVIGLVHMLEMMNSSANFYIYVTRGSRFRAMLSQLCCWAKSEVASRGKVNNEETVVTTATDADK